MQIAWSIALQIVLAISGTGTSTIAVQNRTKKVVLENSRERPSLVYEMAKGGNNST
jgi:hypothetical protein